MLKALRAGKKLQGSCYKKGMKYEIRNSENRSIKELDERERPREKLIALGANIKRVEEQ